MQIIRAKMERLGDSKPFKFRFDMDITDLTGTEGKKIDMALSQAGITLERSVVDPSEIQAQEDAQAQQQAVYDDFYGAE